MSPSSRGENKKYVSCHHLAITFEREKSQNQLNLDPQLPRTSHCQQLGTEISETGVVGIGRELRQTTQGEVSFFLGFGWVQSLDGKCWPKNTLANGGEKWWRISSHGIEKTQQIPGC